MLRDTRITYVPLLVFGWAHVSEPCCSCTVVVVIYAIRVLGRGGDFLVPQTKNL